MLHPADVCLSSRSPHSTPPTGQGNGSGIYDTWGAAAGFNATRLDWVYTLDAEFVQQAHERGLGPVTLAINPQVPDTGSKPPTFKVGRVLNIELEPLVAPWMRTWAHPSKNYYGCANAPEYNAIAQERARALVAAGADGIQHDDYLANSEVVSWGNPHSSGCYCSHCMGGFTRSLGAALNASAKRRLNFTDSFDYRRYVTRSNSAGRVAPAHHGRDVVTGTSSRSPT